MAGGFEFVEEAEHGVVDVAELFGGGDLSTGGVGDIEDIDDLVEVSGDLRRIDVEAQFMEHAGECEKQAGAVVGEDVDDGGVIG